MLCVLHCQAHPPQDDLFKTKTAAGHKPAQTQYEKYVFLLFCALLLQQKLGKQKSSTRYFKTSKPWQEAEQKHINLVNDFGQVLLLILKQFDVPERNSAKTILTFG